jgi:hypothetical protein
MCGDDSGTESREVLDKNLEIMRNFKPLSESEMKAQRVRCHRLACDGRLELFQKTTQYDGAIGRQQYHPFVKELPAYLLA